MFVEGINIEEHMSTFLSTMEGWQHLNTTNNGLLKKMELGLSLDGKTSIWKNQLPRDCFPTFIILCATVCHELYLTMSLCRSLYLSRLENNLVVYKC